MSDGEFFVKVIGILFVLAALISSIYLGIANYDECRETHSMRYCLTHGG